MTKQCKIEKGAVKLDGSKISKILLVDDSRVVGLLLKSQLENLIGCDVTYVDNGKEALKLYKETTLKAMFFI